MTKKLYLWSNVCTTPGVGICVWYGPYVYDIRISLLCVSYEGSNPHCMYVCMYVCTHERICNILLL